MSALIKVRHEEAGAILGIEGEKLGQCRCWASAPTRLYPSRAWRIAAVCGCLDGGCPLVHALLRGAKARTPLSRPKWERNGPNRDRS